MSTDSWNATNHSTEINSSAPFEAHSWLTFIIQMRGYFHNLALNTFTYPCSFQQFVDFYFILLSLFIYRCYRFKIMNVKRTHLLQNYGYALILETVLCNSRYCICTRQSDWTQATAITARLQTLHIVCGNTKTAGIISLNRNESVPNV